MTGRVLGLVLEQLLAPVPGGTGRYTRELTAALVAEAPSGWQVRGVTAWHRDRAAARVAGLPEPARLPLGRRALAEAWRGGLPPGVPGTVVHAPTLLVPPRRRRQPLVVTVHDAVPWTSPETLTARGAAWHQAMGERVAQHADLVVTPTRAVADALRAVLPLREVMVVGHGVSPSLQLPPDADRRAAAMALPAGGYLVTLATLEPRKGLDVLLAALAEPTAPDLPLLLVGQPGWGGVDPHAEAARLTLDPGRVRVLGWRSDPDVAVLLDRASALVVPSRDEGFGLPLLEGLAAGLPVVTSDAPALREVGGDAAVAVPVGDAPGLAAALRRVVDDPALAARLRVAGPARAREFTWQRAAARLWPAYDDLAAKAR